MGVRSALVVAAIAAATLAGVAPVHADVRVAVYAPWSGPATADERHAFSLEIERAVADAGLGRATVSSFAKLADLRRAIAAGTIDVALVDAGADAVLGKRLTTVASWSSGAPWILAAKQRPASLRGQRLALQARDAPTSVKTVARLLRGEVPSRYWAAIVGAPVTADARELVVRGKADLVVLPRSMSAGLLEVADLGSFSELSLRAADAPPALLAAVKAAVQARFGGAWSSAAPAFPAPVRLSQPVFATTPSRRLSVLELASRASTPAPTLDLAPLWIDDDAR